MKPDPILEEIWKVKDRLAREANYDTNRFFDILRQWESDHPHQGRGIRSAKELRDLMAEAEEEHQAALLKEAPRTEQD
jgi:hypothetical protein